MYPLACHTVKLRLIGEIADEDGRDWLAGHTAWVSTEQDLGHANLLELYNVAWLKISLLIRLAFYVGFGRIKRVVVLFTAHCVIESVHGVVLHRLGQAILAGT